MLSNIDMMVKSISDDKIDDAFLKLYKNDENSINEQKKRYIDAINNFKELFPDFGNAVIFSTPGRTEIGGNHTDHNQGLVIAAAVDLDVISIAAVSNDDNIIIKSEGYSADVININELEPKNSELYKSAALIRGICEGFKRIGYDIKGFRAYTTSNVLKGSGLSSSAAFEVLVASMINHFFCNNEVSDLELAKIAQFAENEYFGKPCGLMDQLACSVGGFIMIDFKNKNTPKVTKIGYDFSDMNMDLVIINTGGSHSDMNDDYASVPADMKAVASVFGKDILRSITIEDVISNIKIIREQTSDRAVLRALHYFNENRRVRLQYEALKTGDRDKFLELVRESGDSSWKLCQNCYSCKDTSEQGITLALSLSEHLLGGNGSYRVHGGGFAGTIQVYVPKDMTADYMEKMNAALGSAACQQLIIRSIGNTVIDFS